MKALLSAALILLTFQASAHITAPFVTSDWDRFRCEVKPAQDFLTFAGGEHNTRAEQTWWRPTEDPYRTQGVQFTGGSVLYDYEGDMLLYNAHDTYIHAVLKSRAHGVWVQTALGATVGIWTHRYEWVDGVKMTHSEWTGFIPGIPFVAFVVPDGFDSVDIVPASGTQPIITELTFRHGIEEQTGPTCDQYR